MRDIINTLDNQIATVVVVARELRNFGANTSNADDVGRLNAFAERLEEVARNSTKQIDELRSHDSDVPTSGRTQDETSAQSDTVSQTEREDAEQPAA